SRFVQPALRAVAHPQPKVWVAAAELLGEIGSPKEASVLVALMANENYEANLAAAKALEATGGPSEVVALTAWLKGSSHNGDKELRDFVRGRRDVLKARFQ